MIAPVVDNQGFRIPMARHGFYEVLKRGRNKSIEPDLLDVAFQSPVVKLWKAWGQVFSQDDFAIARHALNDGLMRLTAFVHIDQCDLISRLSIHLLLNIDGNLGLLVAVMEGWFVPDFIGHLLDRNGDVGERLT